MSFSAPAAFGTIKNALHMPDEGVFTPDLPVADLPIITLSIPDAPSNTGQPEFAAVAAPTFPPFAAEATAAAYVASNAVVQFINPTQSTVPDYSLYATVDAPAKEVVDAPPTLYPEAGLIGMPENAGLASVNNPEISLGDLPDLLDIMVSGFTEAEIEMFSVDAPSTTPNRPRAVVDLSAFDVPDPWVYTNDFDDLRRLTYEHADIAVRTKEELGVRTAMTVSAAKGFSLPNGAAAEQSLAVIRDASRMRMEAVLRGNEVSYERDLQFFEVATSHAMLLEKKYADIHISYYAKLIELQKFDVEQHISLLKTDIELFNARVRVLNMEVAAYTAYIQAVLEQHSGHSAELSALSAKVDKYKAEVGMYTAQIGTADAIGSVALLDTEQALLKVKEYETYLNGVDTNIKLVKLNLEAYRSAVAVYSKVVDDDVAYVEAYSDYVDAEREKLQVGEANIQAYASFWSAEKARTGYYENWGREVSNVVNAEVANYKEYSNAQRSYISAMSDKVSGSVDAIRTYVSSVDTMSNYASSYNRAYAAWQAFDAAVTLQTQENKLVEDTLRTNRQAEEAKLEYSRLAATATIHAGLAQAAYSVIGGSISASANASASASGSQSHGLSQSVSIGDSKQHSRSKSLSV